MTPMTGPDYPTHHTTVPEAAKELKAIVTTEGTYRAVRLFSGRGHALICIHPINEMELLQCLQWFSGITIVRMDRDG